MIWEPKARVAYENFFALRVNPLGLLQRLRIGYRHRLYDNNSALFQGAWFDAGTEISIAPTYIAAGPRVEIRPLAILSLAATYEFIGYFGSVDTVMPIASTQDSFWETTLQQRGDNGENYPAMGSRLRLQGLLQGKVGPVFVRTALVGLRVDLNLRDGDDKFYDATRDLVLPNGGWAILSDTDAGAIYKGLTAGVRYSYADAFHGTGGPGDQPHHRIGPLVAYTFKENKAGHRWDKPTLLLLAQWYIQHPYRAGQESHQGIPLIALAFQFEGDFWRSKR